MAIQGEHTAKSNAPERVLGGLRDLHLFIGAGALILAEVLVIPALVTVAAYEGLNALAHEGLRQAVKTRPRPSSAAR
jgi:hypothetical protein